MASDIYVASFFDALATTAIICGAVGLSMIAFYQAFCVERGDECDS